MLKILWHTQSAHFHPPDPSCFKQDFYMCLGWAGHHKIYDCPCTAIVDSSSIMAVTTSPFQWVPALCQMLQWCFTCFISFSLSTPEFEFPGNFGEGISLRKYFHSQAHFINVENYILLMES